MTIGFDTLRAVETLTDAGIDAIHARAIVSTMHDAVLERFAPKSDVAKLQTDMAAMKADVHQLKIDVAELQTDMAAVKADVHQLKADVHQLKTDVHQLKIDVAELQTDMAAVKVDIDKLKTDVSQLKTDVADLKAGFSVEVADLKREIANVQATLTWRIVLAIGAFAALSRLAM